jgi:hypothetical protein
MDAASKGEGVHLKIAGHGRRVTACHVLAMTVFVCANLGASWAATPIYKCFDRKFDVVYTDEPCKDGALLDVRAGDADPAAVARLERARDALDQSAAQRIRDMRLVAAQPAFAPPWYAGPSGESWLDYSGANSPYDYGPIWGLGSFGITGFANGRPPHSRPRGAFNSRGFAFTRPNMGGRR